MMTSLPFLKVSKNQEDSGRGIDVTVRSVSRLNHSFTV